MFCLVSVYWYRHRFQKGTCYPLMESRVITCHVQIHCTIRDGGVISGCVINSHMVLWYSWFIAIPHLTTGKALPHVHSFPW
ncbi:hypothetical protein M6B38_199215 [Iris pallida]|uniref:Uncharacterized protein n=1 Tax=Iris pallida TaxID=29817 RepID=A0AAX6EAH1_IRIPA|nr:hypothetical protein M6B38_199215 [Iris pallida]